MGLGDQPAHLCGGVETDVAAALSGNLRAISFQHLDEPLARDDRKGVAHAGIGNRRRITPASNERPSSRHGHPLSQHVET